MIIETKYNIGQEVHFLSDKSKKIECAAIYKLDAEAEYKKADDVTEIKVRYYFYHNNSVEIVREEFCFLTKQDVIDTL
jgi:uncharacterized protein YbjQ (UPF0145 family)